ncbi:MULTISPECIES: sigma-70 family RNA polymerase sigma factor [Spirulina sp. CCY15215]|uniref:sigma-70 family RNA polymerase sigma factor n=1 Tax=Spirulina sp. CCY15215 TaxID=2767591 RepID=UPI00195148C4|nr:sigma-70 family RNA polymerase sigma factor [Spirulina major]
MTHSALRTRDIELLVAYSRDRSLNLRNELIELNSGLVRKVAHQLCRQCNEPYEDLEQTGYLGLIRAIDRFDPKQGRAFSSFALPYVRGEILHYLRDKGTIIKIPRRWQELHGRSQKVSKQLRTELGRIPEDSEIAQSLGVSLQEWRECKMAVKNRLLLSLDATVTRQVDSNITLADTLADVSITFHREQREECSQLMNAIDQLEEKTQTALELVFLKNLTRKEAAKKIGISPMTVTRYVDRGIQQLERLLQVA